MTDNINIRVIPEEEIHKRGKELSFEEIKTEKELIKRVVEPRLNDVIEQCRDQVDKGRINQKQFCECIDTNIDIWLSMCCKGRTLKIFSQMRNIIEEKKRSGEIKC